MINKQELMRYLEARRSNVQAALEGCSQAEKSALQAVEKELRVLQSILDDGIVPLKINHDEDHGILYVSWGEPRFGYEEEISPNVYLRKDEETDKVIGIMLMDYKKNLINC